MSLKPKYVFVKNSSPVTAICFTIASGECLLSGDEEGFITCWNLESYKSISKIRAHTERVVYLLQPSFDHSDTKVLSQGKDGKLNIIDWDSKLSTFIVIKSINISVISLCRFEAMLWKNKHLICVPEDGSNLSLYFDDKKLKFKSQSKGLSLACKLFLLNKAPHLLVGDEGGFIRLFTISETEDCKKINEVRLHEDLVTSLDYDEKNNKGISGSSSNNLILFSLESGTSGLEVFKIKEITITNKGISMIDIRDDCKIVATSGWDQRVRIFSWKNMKPLAVIDFHSDKLECIKFSRELKLGDYILAIGSKDRTISIWSLYNK